MPVASPGAVPADLVKRMMARYKKGPKTEPESLTIQELGLDEETFHKLDTNADGMLGANELGGFVKRTPDLELVLRLGSKEPGLTVVTGAGRSPLAGKLAVQEGLGLLDLGVTRAELRCNDQDRPDRIGGFLRQQYLAQFRQADTDNDGVLDAKEIQNSRFFRGISRRWIATATARLRKQAHRLPRPPARSAKTSDGRLRDPGSSDQSRGLFDLLDINRDGRLSVREMRRAVQLLGQLDRDRKGFLTRADIPRSYRLEVRRGPAAGGAGNIGAFFDLYGGGNAKAEAELPQKGPLWFRKMDRNRDGDVSRKEFLFGDELFRRIDTDGDGLISVEEAEKADILLRRKIEDDE